MSNSIIRTDKWSLNLTLELTHYAALTVSEYRSFCRALSYIVLARWPELSDAESRCSAIERLMHATKKNPSPKHLYFVERFYKFPSYLRRAAIEFACGQVSSFYTRYRDWQGGIRKRRDAKPPRFNPDAGCYPSLYKGQCFKFEGDGAQLKLWDGKEWLWHDVLITEKRDRHTLEHSKLCSPSLIVKGKRVHLSVPFKLKPTKLKGEPVCSTDVGVNTLAVCSIVYPCGTVTARKFIHPTVDIDRRDKQFRRIWKQARKTGTLHKGFCKDQYRKARQYNKNISQQTSRQIVEFAKEHGASVIVFEDLRKWKPKAGRKRSNLKQRFHGWLHRAVVVLTKEKFVECGGKVELVYPRGTSSWAFDGSGKVKRAKHNYALATFQNGKQYNADLAASYNIAARYFAYKNKLTRRNDGQIREGKSPSRIPRMPVVLSDLWLHHKDKMPLMNAQAS